MSDIESKLENSDPEPEVAAPQNGNPYSENYPVVNNGEQPQPYQNQEYYIPPPTPTQQVPQPSEGGIYDLYDNTNYSEDISGWGNIANEQSEHVDFWNTKEALANFTDNATQLHHFNSILWAIPFLMNLCVLFGLYCHWFKTYKRLVEYNKYYREFLKGNIISSMLAVLFAVLLFIEQLIPSISVRFGIFINLTIHLIAYFIRCTVFWTYIFVWLGYLIIGLFFYLITRGRNKYDIFMTKLVNKKVLANCVFICHIFLALLLGNICTGCTIQGSFNMYFEKAIWLWQFYLVVSFYNLVCVLGNCTYMTSCYITAKHYLTGENISGKDLSKAIRRGYIDNFGVACKMSYLLPISEFIHAVARYNPQLTVTDIRVKFPNFAKHFCSIAKPIVRLFQKLARSEMKLLGYPQRRAMAYCAIYGISYEEAVRRYCEVSVTRGASLVDDAYMYDTQYMFKQFSFAMASFYLDLTVSNYGGYQGFCLGRSFFVAFELYYIFRSVMRGFLETIFVLFGEIPEKSESIHPELFETLKQMYATSVRARNESDVHSDNEV